MFLVDVVGLVCVGSGLRSLYMVMEVLGSRSRLKFVGGSCTIPDS